MLETTAKTAMTVAAAEAAVVEMLNLPRPPSEGGAKTRQLNANAIVHEHYFGRDADPTKEEMDALDDHDYDVFVKALGSLLSRGEIFENDLFLEMPGVECCLYGTATPPGRCAATIDYGKWQDFLSQNGLEKQTIRRHFLPRQLMPKESDRQGCAQLLEKIMHSMISCGALALPADVPQSDLALTCDLPDPDDYYQTPIVEICGKKDGTETRWRSKFGTEHYLGSYMGLKKLGNMLYEFQTVFNNPCEA